MLKIKDKISGRVVFLNMEKVVSIEIHEVKDQGADFLEVLFVMENKIYIDNDLYSDLADIEYLKKAGKKGGNNAN